MIEEKIEKKDIELLVRIIESFPPDAEEVSIDYVSMGDLASKIGGGYSSRDIKAGLRRLNEERDGGRLLRYESRARKEEDPRAGDSRTATLRVLLQGHEVYRLYDEVLQYGGALIRSDETNLRREPALKLLEEAGVIDGRSTGKRSTLYRLAR